MKNTFLILFLLFAGLACTTVDSDLKPADHEETHDRIDFEIVPSAEGQNAFDVAISLRRDESFVSIQNRDGYSRRDGQTTMNFPRFIVTSGDEAEIQIGGNKAKVYVDDEGRTVWYMVTFLTDDGTVSASGTINLAANNAEESTQ